jgi:hypothetical protein
MTARNWICAVLSALWIAPAGAAWAGAEAQMAPHRAVYDLELKSAQPRAGIDGASGRMVLEVTGSRCDGWTVSFRIVNDFTLTAGDTRLIDSRSSSWEADDGTMMRYSQRQYVDSRLENEALLTVTRSAVDEPGQIAVTQPEEETFTLPPGALFPSPIKTSCWWRRGKARGATTAPSMTAPTAPRATRPSASSAIDRPSRATRLQGQRQRRGSLRR